MSLAADALLLDRGLGPQWFPVPEFALRRGLNDAWDVGVRLYPAGAELSARRFLYQYRDYRLSALPLLAFGQVSATNADTSFAEVTSGGALLNGVKLTPHIELVFGLRSQLRLGLNAVALREDFAAARWGMLAGGSAAVSLPFGKGRKLLPGFVVLLPYDFNRSRWDVPIFQGGLAVGW